MKHCYLKRPDDVLDYDVDFSRWLPSNDQIEDASYELVFGAVTVERIEYSKDAVKIWVGGGVDGETSELTVTINTENGRTKQVVLQFKTKE